MMHTHVSTRLCLGVEFPKSSCSLTRHISTTFRLFALSSYISWYFFREEISSANIEYWSFKNRACSPVSARCSHILFATEKKFLNSEYDMYIWLCIGKFCFPKVLGRTWDQMRDLHDSLFWFLMRDLSTRGTRGLFGDRFSPDESPEICGQKSSHKNHEIDQ